MTSESGNFLPDGALVRDELARLRLYAEFANSPRLASFLDYIVTETLAGRGEALRAYTIATSVFERGSDFDPHSNSIVRVEATRLRRALKNYYEGEGATNRIRIDVPLGAYLPRFIDREATQAPPPYVEAPTSARKTPAAPPATRPAASAVASPARGRYLVGAGVAATIAIGFVLGAHVLQPARDAGAANVRPRAIAALADTEGARPQPIVLVRSTSVGADDIEAYAIAGGLQRDVATALSLFDEISVVRGFSRMARETEGPRVDYELRSHVDNVVREHAEATFQLLHAGDNRVVWSGAFTLTPHDADPKTHAALIRSIVTPIAQPFGAVASDLRGRVDSGTPTPGSIECMARFEDFWEIRSEPKRRAAHDCLTAAIAEHPRTAIFHVALSNLYVAEYLGDLPRLGDKPSLVAAELAAERAIKLAPGRAHPYLALSQVLNLRGDYEKALHLAEHALELNPHDTEIMAQLGAIYVLRGKLADGARLLNQALDANPAYPGWMRFYLFLEAYMRGDKDAQHNALSAIGPSEEPDAALARVIAAAEAGQVEAARKELVDLRARFPSFAAAPRAALERLTLAPDVVERMMQAASKVGL